MPTQEEVLAHIKRLEGEQMRLALEYVWRAPAQVRTRYRQAIEQALDSKIFVQLGMDISLKKNPFLED
jgi:hypothetical protein